MKDGNSRSRWLWKTFTGLKNADRTGRVKRKKLLVEVLRNHRFELGKNCAGYYVLNPAQMSSYDSFYYCFTCSPEGGPEPFSGERDEELYTSS